MEIEFSPNQVPAPQPSKPANVRTIGSTSPEDVPPVQGMAELQRKLNNMALTRPDRMQAAAQALSDVKYPPD